MVLTHFCFTEVKAKQKQYDALSVNEENSVASYSTIRTQLDLLGDQFRSFITKPEYLKPFLQPGRLVKVCLCEKHYYCPTVQLKKAVQWLLLIFFITEPVNKFSIVVNNKNNSILDTARIVSILDIARIVRSFLTLES